MGTILKQISQNAKQKEVLINEINQSLSPSAKFGRRNVDNPGLNYYYYGGKFADSTGALIDVQDGYVTCLPNSTNYIEYKIGTGMQVNQTSYTSGSIPVAKCTTNSTTITIFINDLISVFLPLGTSPYLSGGSSGGGSSGDGSSGGGSSTSVNPAFGDLTVTNDNVGYGQTTIFNVKGGKNWHTGKIIKESNAVTIPDFISSNNFSYLDANSVYYVVLDYYSNTIKTLNANSSIYLVGNAKLLWVIETNSTKISKVTDYRVMSLFIKNKTLINSTYFYPGSANTYTLNMSTFINHNQVADSDTLYSIGGQYPRFIIPSLSLLCYSSDYGYSPGEEVDYVTSDSSGTIWGKPYAIKNYGDVEVYFGSNVKIWNKTTQTWVTPNSNCWAIVCKLSMDYHS